MKKIRALFTIALLGVGLELAAAPVVSSVKLQTSLLPTPKATATPTPVSSEKLPISPLPTPISVAKTCPSNSSPPPPPTIEAELTVSNTPEPLAEPILPVSQPVSTTAGGGKGGEDPPLAFEVTRVALYNYGVQLENTRITRLNLRTETGTPREAAARQAVAEADRRLAASLTAFRENLRTVLVTQLPLRYAGVLIRSITGGINRIVFRIYAPGPNTCVQGAPEYLESWDLTWRVGDGPNSVTAVDIRRFTESPSPAP